MSAMRGHIDACFEQRLDDSGSAILTSPLETCLHLRLRGVRLQTAVWIEEAFYQVEPPHSGRSFQIQVGAALRQELGGLPTSIGQTANDGTALGRRHTYIDDRAMVQQDLHQRDLHTGLLWMDAGGSQPESS